MQRHLSCGPRTIAALMSQDRPGRPSEAADLPEQVAAMLRNGWPLLPPSPESESAIAGRRA
jgi:hypothetical protein